MRSPNSDALASLTYEFLSPHQSFEVAEYYRRFYPTLGWSEPHVRWQYFDNPSGHSRVWVVRSAGRIVSTFAAVPFDFCLNGRIEKVWRIQDVLTEPAFRGRGIFHHLLAKTDTGVLLGYTLPKDTGQSYNAFVRTGWEKAFRLPLMINASLADLEGSLPRGFGKSKVEPISRFGGIAEDVWKGHQKTLSFGVVRSAAHLNWRYLESAKGKYFPFLLRIEGTGSQAVLILKSYTREDGSRWTHLCDFFQSAPDPRVIELVVRHWFDFSRTLEAQGMSCWSGHGSLASYLAQKGWVEPESNSHWLMVNPALAKKHKNYKNKALWHLTMGDSDVF